jgi:carbonic anhydrase
MTPHSQRFFTHVLAVPAAAVLFLVLPLMAAANSEDHPATSGESTKIHYTVAPGNNLFRIALTHGTTVEAIQQENGLTSTRIHVGQTLTIPQADTKPIAVVKKETPQTPHTEASKPQRKSTPGQEAHWEYEGPNGPSAWGKLSPEFAACAEGRAQTPIDIAQPVLMGLSDIKFHYTPGKGQIVNNGHTMQINYPKGSSIEVDGRHYELIQFHFHTPSEHTIKGKRYDMELHLVHKDAEGHLVVVGVLMKKGENNDALNAVWAAFPQEAGAPKNLAGEVNANAVLPTGRRFYRYTGSLTTPPCSENVKWLLMESPITVSQAQVQVFQKLFPYNSRPVQPVNNRVVLLDADSD